MHDRAALDQVARQMKIVLGHCRKPNGLLLHGWGRIARRLVGRQGDGPRAGGLERGTGLVRGLIADGFDYLPKDHPDRATLLSALRSLCAGLKDVQDPRTGMWVSGGRQTGPSRQLE